MLGSVRLHGCIASLKRAAVVGVAAMMLALPGTAFATAFFKGPVNGSVSGAGVEFRAKFRHGDPKKVLEFRWFNVPVPPNCGDSFNGHRFKMRVNDKRKFHGTYTVPNSDHKATVHGKLKHHDEKASGTLELKGTKFSGGCTGDTGALPWTANRAGT